MDFLEDALARRPHAQHSTATPCASNVITTEEPQQILMRHGRRRRRRLHLGFLGFLGPLLGGRGGQAYQMDYIQITRPSTCPEGLERVLGWAADTCSGMDAYNFDNMVLDLSKHGIMNYTRLHLTDTKFLDAVLKDCIFYANGGYAHLASELVLCCHTPTTNRICCFDSTYAFWCPRLPVLGSKLTPACGRRALHFLRPLHSYDRRTPPRPHTIRYHAEASEVLGTNGQFCPSASMYYEGFQRSICDNRFLKSTFDARYPSNETVTMTLTVPQGCNLACGCCGPGGNRCHKVRLIFVSSARVRARGERAPFRSHHTPSFGLPA